MRRQHLTQLIGTLIVATALVGLSTVAFATMEAGPHDFAGLGWNGNDEICAVCHTPHNSDTDVADAPLWDHLVATGASFTQYPAGGTLDATVPVPAGVSLLCLSCHDGTTAMDAFGGNAGAPTVMAAGLGANFGTNLANDHPISFVYNQGLSTTDGGLFDPENDNSGLGGTIEADMLFGTAGSATLECASCHDVHADAAVTNLLRIPNTDSDLCLTCHDK